jgi:integrase/recombinase XerD
MGLFRNFTKHIFGGKQVEELAEVIVDGRVIQPGDPLSAAVLTGSFPLKTKILPVRVDLENEIQPARVDLTGEVNPAAPPSEEPLAIGKPWKLSDEYLVFLRAANRSERTISEYCYDLNAWNRQYPLHRITRNQLEKAVSQMRPATARRKIAALKSLAKWQLRDGDTRLHTVLGQINPPKLPGRVPKDRGSDDFQRWAGRAKELCQQSDRRGLWLGLMLCCGLRISEIQTAELMGNGTVKVTGKGDKERLLPAPVWLRAELERQLGPTWRKGRNLIWLEMKALGICRPHSLRHTYASELIRKGFPLEEIQKLLGHANINTTLIYAKIRVPENVTQKLGVE